MARVIFIHGYGGSPDDERFAEVLRELEEKGWDVMAPAMPATDHPRKDAWVRALRECISEPDAQTFLVGFSLGCITILRYLETLPNEQRVGGALLLAGFFEDLGPDFTELRSFVDMPVDWDAVKSACPEFTVVHGDDDPLVPLPFAERLAKNLEVPLQVEHGVGHFNTAWGAKIVAELMESTLRGLQSSPEEG